jgi:RNA polymerase sigma factor (sigma-70 family)
LSQNAGNHSANGAPASDGDSRTPKLVVEGACVEWQADLMSFLLGVLRDRHQAEDAFQKMVVRAIEAADSAHPETLRGWLFRIALNEARQIQRENRRNVAQVERFAEEQTTNRIQVVNAQLLADVGLLSEELVHSIQRSLVRLPAEQQEVIRRRMYEGLTFAEIAAQMNQPLGTVLTWMRRGLQRLREDSGLRSLLDD